MSLRDHFINLFLSELLALTAEARQLGFSEDQLDLQLRVIDLFAFPVPKSFWRKAPITFVKRRISARRVSRSLCHYSRSAKRN